MSKQQLQEATDAVLEKISDPPRIGLILGSGLGCLASEIKNSVTIPYAEIPHFPIPTVAGHAGEFVVGELEGKRVGAFSGRCHFYEGHSLEKVVFSARLLKKIGVEILYVTNAAGGINTEFEVGDLMLISDHINNLGSSPLMGENDEDLGPRFPDMTEAYDKELRGAARHAAKVLGIPLREGVYVASPGPNYETPAEIRMLRAWGADAAGMSTVPEVIAARHCGIRCVGVSCITNMAAGILPEPLSHAEVIETTEKVRGKFLKLSREIVRQLP